MNSWKAKSIKGSVEPKKRKNYIAFRENQDGTVRQMQWVPSDDSRFGLPNCEYFWAPNNPFQSSLRINDIVKTGRSSVTMVLSDIEGNTYAAFLSCSMEIISRAERGVVSGMWRFVRKGANWGIELMEEAIEHFKD